MELRSCQSLCYSRIPEHFMEPGGSLPCSQEPSTSEPVQCSPITTSYFSKINFNIIPSPKLGLLSGFLPYGFPTKILYTDLLSSKHPRCPAHLTPLDFIIINIVE
jgi:hypothetical protein